MGLIISDCSYDCEWKMFFGSILAFICENREPSFYSLQLPDIMLYQLYHKMVKKTFSSTFRLKSKFFFFSWELWLEFTRLDSNIGVLLKLSYSQGNFYTWVHQIILNIIEDFHIDFFNLFWLSPTEALFERSWALFLIFSGQAPWGRDRVFLLYLQGWDISRPIPGA